MGMYPCPWAHVPPQTPPTGERTRPCHPADALGPARHARFPARVPPLFWRGELGGGERGWRGRGRRGKTRWRGCPPPPAITHLVRRSRALFSPAERRLSDLAFGVRGEA